MTAPRHLHLVKTVWPVGFDTAPGPVPTPAVSTEPIPRSARSGIKYGARYEDNLDVAEIAKRVRADIKAGVAAGELPAAKYSVRISRYSMGRSLNVTIDELPFSVCNHERVRQDVMTPYDGRATLLLRSEPAQAVMDKVEAMLEAYNFDGSRPQEDYSHVNFYGHVNMGSQYDREWTELHALYEAKKLEALRPVREANLAKHEALARRNACPAKWTHNEGSGCGLCEG